MVQLNYRKEYAIVLTTYVLHTTHSVNMELWLDIEIQTVYSNLLQK